jgi:hypothetical protein
VLTLEVQLKDCKQSIHSKSLDCVSHVRLHKGNMLYLNVTMLVVP